MLRVRLFPTQFLTLDRLATNLLMNFLQPKGSMRIGARSALTHPWITGNTEDVIPLTAHEFFLAQQTKNRIYGMMKLLPFFVYLKDTDGY